MLYQLISQIPCRLFSTEVWLGHIMTGVNLSIPILVPMIFSTWVISLEVLQAGESRTFRTFAVHTLVLSETCGDICVFLFRCDIIEVAAEIDRILRPGRWFVLKDTIEMIKKMRPVLKSLHYETVVVKQQFLVAKKSFWRPGKPASWSGWHRSYFEESSANNNSLILLSSDQIDSYTVQTQVGQGTYGRWLLLNRVNTYIWWVDLKHSLFVKAK